MISSVLQFQKPPVFFSSKSCLFSSVPKTTCFLQFKKLPDSQVKKPHVFFSSKNCLVPKFKKPLISKTASFPEF